MNLYFSKFFSEFIFLLGDVYFILNIIILFILTLLLSRIIFSLHFNTLVIDLSFLLILFSIFFLFYSFEINVDLFFGFSVNKLLFLFKTIVYFFLIFFFLSSRNVFLFDRIINFEYTFFILFSIESFFLIVFTKNLFIFFLAIELQLLCSYVMASLKRHSNFSTEAGIKYFLFGAFSSSLLLFGISFVYGIFGTLDILNIFFLLNYFTLDVNLLLFFSFFFIFVGILFKLGAAPFHWWLPDVYEGSPTVVTLFFSIFPKLSLIFFILKIIYLLFFFNMNILFFIVGISSIFIGFLNAMYQFKFKRFFAYSSIFTIGFLILSLSQISLDSFFVSIFYLVTYSFPILILFFYVLQIRFKNFNELYFLYDLSYLSSTNRFLAFIVAFVFFSLAGIPPLVGFFGKFFLFLFFANNYNYFIIFIVLFAGVVSSFYYVRVVRILFFTKVIEYKQLFVFEFSMAFLFVILLNFVFFFFFDFFAEFIFITLFKSFFLF